MVDNGFDENFDEDFLGIGDDWNNTFQEEVGYTSKFDCQLNAINSLAIDQSEYLTSNDKNDFSQGKNTYLLECFGFQYLDYIWNKFFICNNV